MLKRLFVLSTLYICSFGTGFANGSTHSSPLLGQNVALEPSHFPTVEKIQETRKSISGNDPLRSILDVNEVFGLNEDAARFWPMLAATDEDRIASYLALADAKTPAARGTLLELGQLRRRLSQYFETSFLTYKGMEVDFDLTLINKGESPSIPIAHPLFTQILIETLIRDISRFSDDASDEARGSIVNRLMALSLLAPELGLARAGLFPCPARAPLSKFLELNIMNLSFHIKK